VGKFCKPLGKRTEILFSLQLSRCAESTDGRPVIIPIPEEDFVFAFALGVDFGQLADNLESLFIGLGPAV